MAYTNEELTIIVNNHSKDIQQNTKDINVIKKDYGDMKADIKETKFIVTNIQKVAEKLDNEREERLQAESKQISNLKVALITAIVTSVGTGIGAFILSKFVS